MSEHIGIVACSGEGAALCYTTICVEGTPLFGTFDHPEVSMHTHSLAKYMACIERGDWPAVGDLMLTSAQKLAAAGANFLICPDNAVHQAMPYVAHRSPLRWLHIAQVVAARAVECGYRRVGLTGTKYLVDSDVYPNELSARAIECVLPTAAERDAIDKIVMQDLVRGVFTPDAVATVQRAIARMKKEGCDGVILGCSELPLVITDDNSPLPTLDSTRLLARAALRLAVGPGPALHGM